MNKLFALAALGMALSSFSFGAGRYHHHYRHHHYYHHHYRHHSGVGIHIKL